MNYNLINYHEGENEMKICKQCGKSVADDVSFCPSCGEKVENVVENTEDTAIIPEQVLENWKNENSKNKFIVEKATSVLTILAILLGIISVIIFIKGSIDIGKRIREMKGFSYEIKIEMLVNDLGKVLRLFVIFAILIAAVPTANEINAYITIRIADYIKKEKLATNDVIKGITEGKMSMEEYAKCVPAAFKNRTGEKEKASFIADALYIAENPLERSRETKKTILCWGLRVIARVLWLIFVVNYISVENTNIIAESSIMASAMSIFKTPLFYAPIVVGIFNMQYGTRYEQKKKERKMKWLEETAKDVFVETK